MKKVAVQLANPQELDYLYCCGNNYGGGIRPIAPLSGYATEYRYIFYKTNFSGHWCSPGL